MEWQYSLYLLLAPLSAVLSLAALFYVRLCIRAAARDMAALQWLIACLVGWLALNTLELVATTPAQTLFWARLGYLFIVATPVCWLVFALHHTGRSHWLPPGRLAALAVVPTLVLAVLLVGDGYTLLWQEYEFRQTGRLLSIHIVRYGPLFWGAAAYSYTLILAGALLLVRHYGHTFQLYRHQARLMMAGALIPIGCNAVHVLHVIPGLLKDYTPISFALACFVFIVGMSRYRLFEVKPVARDVVVDALDDPVLALDTKGRIVDLNNAAITLIGSLLGEKRAGQWIGRQVSDVLAAWPELARLLPAREEIYASLNVELADGCRHYDCHVLPLSNPRGAPAGQVVVLHDVTEHKQAEAELVHYAQALEAQNRELDAFARTVAHDLQNPLTIISAYTDLLDQESAEMSAHDLQTFLRAIADSTEWMTHIVEELLLLAGVRRMEDVPTCCLDMEPIVHQAVRQLDRLIQHSQANVTVADGWPLVIGHAPWVGEVWINYLSNALKYGGRPDLDLPPRVDIGFDLDARATHVRFWVHDRGRGIPLEDQDRLFTEFSRVNGHESGPKGHGLGLSIVQRIVDRLGGEVGVDSCVGEGSTFWFTLPRASITVPSPDRSETTPPPPERLPDTLHAARDRTLQ